MSGSPPILLHALNHPENMASLSLSSWDLLIRQARSAGLLTNLHDAIDRLGELDSVPERPRNHLKSARTLTDKHQRDVHWEVSCILEALKALKQPITLLKGTAYLIADLPVSKGRLFSDIDILVPKEAIEEVEQTLRLKGWMLTTHDAYDQRYYRTWMHELPPLRHATRNTVLDVHHNILPETARLHPSPKKLLQAAISVNEDNSLYVLNPADMVLHSATHLFHDGELEHGLRDLVDLDGLLRHFGGQEDFWLGLVERAGEMDLTRPLYYALRYSKKFLGTPIPEETMIASQTGSPPAFMPYWMDMLFLRALAPDHRSCRDWFSGTARLLLFIRAHFLRMPLHLLIPHLFHKAFISPRSNGET